MPSSDASRLVRRGVLGAVLVLLSLGLVLVLAAPPFLELDETGHVAYGVAVSEGRLPGVTEDADTGMPTQREYFQRHGAQPPLYYALVAPIVGAGSGSEYWAASVRGARAVSLVASVITVVATAAIAGMLARRRRAEVMVVAAGLAASLSVFTATSSFVRNDSLAVAGGAVALLGAFGALRDGLRPRWVALACVGSAWTLGTRFNGIVLVLLVALGLAAASFLRSTARGVARAAPALLVAGLPLVCVVATSGWFYWRNYDRYGDINATSLIHELHGDLDPTYSLFEWLVEPTAIPTVLLQAQGAQSWDTNLFSPAEDVLLILALALVSAGAVRALWAWRRTAGATVAANESRGIAEANGSAEAADATEVGADERGATVADQPVAARHSRAVMVLLAIALPLTAWYQLSLWVSYAGNPLSRYLLVALPVLAAGAAAACLGHPGRWGRLVAVGLISLQAAFALLGAGRWLGYRWFGLSGNAVDNLVEALDYAGIPQPGLILALLAAGVVAGITLQASALGAIGRLAPGPTPALRATTLRPTAARFALGRDAAARR